MKLYFDGTLIDTDYYTQCNQTGLLFNENDTFKLGSTVCRSFTIGVDKNAISEIPTNIEFEIDNVRYKQFRIDKYEENDVEYIFYLVDRMIDLDFKYDASELIEQSEMYENFSTIPFTIPQVIGIEKKKCVYLGNILVDICNKIGVSVKTDDGELITEDNDYLTTESGIRLGSEELLNTWWSHKKISWYDNKITAREYISMIAELNGGYAIINNNNEMEIRTYNNNVVYELNSLNCDSLKVGNRHEITKVVYDFGIYKYEAGTDGEIVYINQNNKFITSQNDINEIYGLINGFEFYTITNQNATIGNADIGECIRVDNEYLTIVQINNWKYNVNTWIGGYNLNINSSTLEGSVIEETYTQEHIRNLDVQIDRANNQLVLKATADGHIAQVNLGADASEGSTFNVNADNINLEGYTTINNGFSIDTNGNATMNNANINGGDIILTANDPSSWARFRILGTGPVDGWITYMMPGSADLVNNITWGSYSSDEARCKYNDNSKEFDLYVYDTGPGLDMYGNSTNTSITMDCYDTVSENPTIRVKRNSDYTSITQNGVWSPSFNNNSQESKKKNIQLDDGCLQQILETDICSFNWKYEDDGDQKHIGCIIADEGGNYKIAPKVLTHDKDAVDLYSMNGMSWKAIQELYDIIKVQQNKINELEEKLNGIN